MIRNKYITIQAATFTPDLTGGTVATYSNYWAGWASVDEGNFKQAMEFGQPTGNQPIKVTVRKNDLTAGINTAMRLVYRANTYNIVGTREKDPFTLEIVAHRKWL
jgi:head-tail adaptor